TLEPLLVITKVFGPVLPSVPDTAHASSEASTVISAGASLPACALVDSDSWAWQPARPRAASAAASAAAEDRTFTCWTFRERDSVGGQGTFLASVRVPWSGAGIARVRRRGSPSIRGAEAPSGSA